MLVVYEQSLAADEDLVALGAAWSSTLRDFVGVGGVIVVVDGGSGNGGTWQLLDAAGLVRISGVSAATHTRARVTGAADAIARGMPPAYRAEAESISYRTSDPGAVVENDDGALALHLTYELTSAPW